MFPKIARGPLVREPSHVQCVALEPFGRFRLLKRIGEGGMGEIFFARSASIDGFEKKINFSSSSFNSITVPPSQNTSSSAKNLHTVLTAKLPTTTMSIMIGGNRNTKIDPNDNIWSFRYLCRVIFELWKG